MSGETHVVIKADLSKFVEAMEKAAQALARLTKTPVWLVVEKEVRNHPRPLCIDGREYHRRRKGRRPR